MAELEVVQAGVQADGASDLQEDVLGGAVGIEAVGQIGEGRIVQEPGHRVGRRAAFIVNHAGIEVGVGQAVRRKNRSVRSLGVGQAGPDRAVERGGQTGTGAQKGDNARGGREHNTRHQILPKNT